MDGICGKCGLEVLAGAESLSPEEPGETEVKVTLTKTKNRKVIRTFRETMTWVWVDDEWYCEEPEE